MSWEIDFKEYTDSDPTEVIEWEEYHKFQNQCIELVSYNEKNPADDKKYRVLLSGSLVKSIANKYFSSFPNLIIPYSGSFCLYDSDDLDTILEFITLIKEKTIEIF